MKLSMLKCKLHRATVTASDLAYEGSIGIDRELMDIAGLLPFECVDVLNINNGVRFSTYVIEAPKGDRDIIVNGAAARLVYKGDLVIICAFAGFAAEEATNYQPKLVLLGEGNEVKNA